MREKHRIEVEPVSLAPEAVRGVDIAALCASGIEPMFFKEWLEPGMHVVDLTRASTEADFIPAVDIAVERAKLRRTSKIYLPAHFIREALTWRTWPVSRKSENMSRVSIRSQKFSTCEDY